MAAASDDYTVTPASYPARPQTASSTIQCIETTASTVSFADKILITVTQHGRLAHWVCDVHSHTTARNRLTPSRYTCPSTSPQQTTP